MKWHKISDVFSKNFASILSVLTSQTGVRRKCGALHKVVTGICDTTSGFSCVTSLLNKLASFWLISLPVVENNSSKAADEPDELCF